MRMMPIQLHKNKFIKEYRNENTYTMSYFHTAPFASLEERCDYLHKQTYKRQELANILRLANEKWGASSETFAQIERLKDEDSLVVIGGQQAGLLTGPLYSLNKVISILQYAKEQEEKLNVPVIPVFWIAGEDHDYEEINHTYIEEDEQLKKHRINHHLYKRESLSHVKANKEALRDWVYDILRSMQETEYTKDLLKQIEGAIDKSDTYVDFFACLIHDLFAGTGIVLIDSANNEVRQLESDMFLQLIEKQEAIAQSVYEETTRLQQNGYPIDLDVEQDDGHLFYHDENNERILLKREGENWIGKNDEVLLSHEEMIRCAKETPQKLSNNVVTRPLMQEYLFPTLAFIAGDGEISYWATLKGAFEAVNMEMPPVIPRLSFTYVTKRVEKRLEDLQLDAEEVVLNGATEKKFAWLMAQNEPPIHLVVEQVLEAVEQAHAPLRDWSKEFADDLGRLADANLKKIKENIHFMEKRMENAVQEKYKHELATYTYVENMLHPRKNLQERIWSPIILLNEYGNEWIKEVIAQRVTEDESHYLVFLG